MLIGRHTAAQLAEIPFGVHVSMCFTARRERAHIPPRYGAAHGHVQELTPGSVALFGWKIVCKNHPLVSQQNTAGS